MNAARMLRRALLGLGGLALLANPGTSFAAEPTLHVDPSVKDCSVRFAPGLTQPAFARFVREFGSVSAFKLNSGPAPLGRNRIALTLEATSFDIDDHADAWNDTFVHPDATHDLGSNHQFPELRVRAGLRNDLDLGLFYTRNFNANYGWAGIDLKYTPLQQNARMPVWCAVRAAYTRTLYVKDMEMNTLTSDFVVGRTFFGSLTPYLAAGSDLVLARETTDAVMLNFETQDVSHTTAGAEYRLGRLLVGGEADWGAVTSFQFQLTGLF